jgi:hypothetical protein
MKLIGLVTLDLPKILATDGDGRATELGKTIAFDEEGKAWLLVERMTRLPDETTSSGRRFKVGRIDYVCWQALEPLRVRLAPVPFFVEQDAAGPWQADGRDPNDEQQ